VMVRPCLDDMMGLTVGDAVGDVDAGTVHESHGAGHNKAAAGQPVAATIARQRGTSLMASPSEMPSEMCHSRVSRRWGRWREGWDACGPTCWTRSPRN
jgi:hypothetical protein